MITHICDRCGRPIEKGELRYVAKLQVYAAADTLEITPEDLALDRRDEIVNLLRQCGKLSEEELMRGVFVELQFDLCRRCQRAYLAAPLLGGSERAAEGGRVEG